MNAEVQLALRGRRPRHAVDPDRATRTLVRAVVSVAGPLRRSLFPRNGRVPAQTARIAPPIDDVDFVVLEGHQDVRNAIRRTIARHDDPSGRETKRLLNIWQFYLRLLLRTTPVTSLGEAVELAIQVVVLDGAAFRKSVQ